MNPSAPLIELIPATERVRFAALIGRFAGRLVVAVSLAILLLILARFAGVALIHRDLAGGAEEFSRIAGLDRRLAEWLTGIVSWTASLALIGLIGPFILAFFWPFATGLRLWKPAFILLAVSGLGAMAPVAIKTARGVDDDGLPRTMAEVDPATATWFDPAGNALIFFADHLDGERRYWNRPGHTPRDRAEARAVTSEAHADWLARRARMEQEEALMESRAREEARLSDFARQIEEARATLTSLATQTQRQREESAQAETRAAEARREAEQAQSAAAAEARRLESIRQEFRSNPVPSPIQPSFIEKPALPVVPVAAPLPVSVPSDPAPQAVATPVSRPQPVPAVLSYRLVPGKVLNIHVNGALVACRADGRTVMWADDRPKRVHPLPGEEIEFEGYTTIHVAPLDSRATEATIRHLGPMPDPVAGGTPSIQLAGTRRW